MLVADTAITEMPDAQTLAETAVEAAGVARRLGMEPRVALLAFSTFGHPAGERSRQVREAVQASSTACGSTSSMTATWPPTSRSTAN